MQVVTLTIRHSCPYSGPLGTTEGVRVTHLCHRGKEAVLEVRAEEGRSLSSLLRAYEASGGALLYEEPARSAALVRFASCACCASGRVIPTLERSGQLYLPPSRYSAEVEQYQFLVDETRFGRHLLEQLPPGVEVVRLRTKPLVSLEFEAGFLVPVGSLLRELTEKQRRAIVTAILRGYYRIPRRVATAELAREVGISRPAFDALLRKAENKLATALFPYLALRRFGRPVPAPEREA
jgi:predicted DNA binding protein